MQVEYWWKLRSWFSSLQNLKFNRWLYSVDWDHSPSQVGSAEADIELTEAFVKGHCIFIIKKNWFIYVIII